LLSEAWNGTWQIPCEQQQLNTNIAAMKIIGYKVEGVLQSYANL
jgi:hypothetical protein